MARQRYINTDFWRDDYIEELDPLEKYLYMYCLTNPLTNIAGIYKISIKRIAFETGLDKDMVNKMLGRFQQHGKIGYIDGHIVIKNFIKHQKINPNIQKGINEVLSTITDDIKAFISLSKPLNYVNVNVNVNNNDKQSKYSEEHLRLSNLLAEYILKDDNNNSYLKPDKRDKTINSWAEDIRKLNEIDNRDINEIENIIHFSKKHDFWNHNIMSGSKLRKQFNTLIMQYKNQKPRQNTNQGQYSHLTTVFDPKTNKRIPIK